MREWHPPIGRLRYQFILLVTFSLVSHLWRYGKAGTVAMEICEMGVAFQLTRLSRLVPA